MSDARKTKTIMNNATQSSSHPLDKHTTSLSVENGTVVLRCSDIRKVFGNTVALDRVNIVLRKGEVHSIIGENGSGKSTLVNVISGLISADEGTVAIDEYACVGYSSFKAKQMGIAVVVQDGTLIDDLTLAENLWLRTGNSTSEVTRRKINDWASTLMANSPFQHLSPSMKAKDLASGDRQLFDLWCSVIMRPTVLLCDESTSRLDAAQVTVALGMIRDAAKHGCAVGFVSHRLFEVFSISDRITVLRDGKQVGAYIPGEIDVNKAVELMAGRSVEMEFPDRAIRTEVQERPIFEVSMACVENYGPISFDCISGSIIGFAGAGGNGQTEFLRALGGTGLVSGSVRVNGKHVTSPYTAVDSGLVYLSSDRRNESLWSALSVGENLSSFHLSMLSRYGIINGRRESNVISRMISDFSIRVANTRTTVGTLSGGNQQKVALAKILTDKVKVLLIEEPTQGVDVRSRHEIYSMLRDAADAGKVIIVLSSDAAELAGLCDRILVFSRGQIVQEIEGTSASEESIVGAFAASTSMTSPTKDYAAITGARSGRLGNRRLHLIKDNESVMGLVGIIILLAILVGVGGALDRTFFSTPNLYDVLLTATPLVIVGAGEFIVIFLGQIDVSIGATIGLIVVVLSFLPEYLGTGVGTAGGVVVVLILGAVIGFGNWLIVGKIGISAIVGTIATLGIIEGIGELLRPVEGGLIGGGIQAAFTAKVSMLPVVLVLVVVLLAILDVMIHRSLVGLKFQAIGLNRRIAGALGINVDYVDLVAYGSCSVLAALAGLAVAAQIGVGDAEVGSLYTLLAIAVPVIGGASLLGGRGMFIGCAVGGIVLAVTEVLPEAIGLNGGYSDVLAGAITVVAIVILNKAIAGHLLNRR